MATKSPVAAITSIGEAAGAVWRTLSDNGSMPMAKLVKAVGLPRDMTMQALGWLAREEKVSVEENGRSQKVSLR